MIEINGGYLEGGGQILRTAISLSVITKKPCHLFNIRKSRPKPGLRPQHLLGLQSLAELSQGRIEGAYLNSKEVRFLPGEIRSKKIHIKIETAGSITLLLQTLILPILFAPEPIEVIVEGGATDTFFSPTADYFRYLLLKIIKKMGARIEVNIMKRGYYPVGGAKIKIKVYPSKIKNIKLIKRGALKKLLALSGASQVLKNKKVAERQLAGVREVLGQLKLPIEERVEYYNTQCPGSQICLIAEFENTVIGTDNLGKLGKRAEDVGKEAASRLLEEERSGACLDKNLADQILPYMALAEGKSSVTVSKVTNHCKTNIWVIEKFLDGKFDTKDGFIAWTPKN
jgi:RNA 3'-terminal phosphate cyclase (GTP)